MIITSSKVHSLWGVPVATGLMVAPSPGTVLSLCCCDHNCSTNPFSVLGILHFLDLQQLKNFPSFPTILYFMNYALRF